MTEIMMMTGLVVVRLLLNLTTSWSSLNRCACVRVCVCACVCVRVCVCVCVHQYRDTTHDVIQCLTAMHCGYTSNMLCSHRS